MPVLMYLQLYTIRQDIFEAEALSVSPKGLFFMKYSILPSNPTFFPRRTGSTLEKRISLCVLDCTTYDTSGSFCTYCDIICFFAVRVWDRLWSPRRISYYT